MWIRRFGRLLALGSALLVLCVPAIVSAQQATSNSWGVSEVYFGPGGQLRDGSTNAACATTDTNGDGVTYCADSSVGDVTVGKTGTAQTGSQSGRDVSLEVAVNSSQCAYYNSNMNLGVLASGARATTNANFSVKSYLASGYTVVTSGAAPSTTGPNAHTLTPLSTPDLLAAGNEQFGINLAANTQPASFGVTPQYLPDSSFSSGTVASNYNQANKFFYQNGSTLATAASSSGTTCYAISYLFGTSNVTPAGTYTFRQSIVVTSSF